MTVSPEYAPNISTETKVALHKDLDAELASIRLRPQIKELWSYLAESNYKIAICSNLALPYGPAYFKNIAPPSRRPDPVHEKPHICL